MAVRRRRWRALCAALAALVVALTFQNPAGADPVRDSGAPPAPAAAVGLDPALDARLAAMGDGDTVPVFARLRTHADLNGITDRDRRVRARRVLSALRTHADARQQAVRRTLRRLVAAGQASKVQAWWIDNAVSFTGTASAVREVAALPEIALVTLDDADIRPLAVPQGIPSGTPATGITATGAPTLWSRGITGASVVVADLDTGVDGTQPDLAGSWRGGSNSWFDPYAQHATPTDVNGHGTWTTSVMVGRDGSGQAVGMAPDAKWIAARVFDDAGHATLSGVHAAFQWVLDPSGDPLSPNPPQVINASWSSSATSCSTEFQPDLAALRTVGIVPVFAAGNSGPATNSGTSPATLPEALAVGSVDGSDTIDVSSSRGPSACAGRTHFPDLVAPGVDVPVDDLYGGSWSASGTSLAAPHVAGALALLLSAHPTTTAADQQAAALSGARDLGPAGLDDTYGAGRIDVVAAEAILAAPGSVGPVTSAVAVSPDPVGGSVLPTVTAILSAGPGGGAPVSARVAVDGGAATALTVSSADGVTTASGPVTQSLADGSHTVAVSAADAAGSWGSPASAAFVADRTAPALSAVAATPSPTDGATSVTIGASAVDPVTGVASAETWVDADPGIGQGTPMAVTTGTSGFSLRAVTSASSLAPGTHTVSVRASDGAGNVGVASSTFAVTAAPPKSFADGFESGNLAAWSATGGAGLSVSGTAALSGRYGLAVTSSRTGGWVRAIVPGTTGPFDVRVLVDPRAMATGSAAVPLVVENASQGVVATVDYRLVSGSAQVRISGRTSAGATKSGSWVPIPSTGRSVVEVDGQPTAGTLTLYVADVVKYSLTGLSSTRIPVSVDVGIVGPQASSVSGGIRVDAVAANRTGHIGTATTGL